MSDTEKPVVLCGLGRTGSRLLEDLKTAAVPVVVIDNRCQADDHRLKSVTFIPGDFRKREILESAGVANARGVIVLTADDLVNIATMLMVRSLSKEVRIVVRLFNQNLMARLGNSVRNIFTLSTSKLTAPFLAMTAMTGQGIGMFDLPTTQVRTSKKEGKQKWYQLAEVRIRAGSSAVGKPIAEVFDPSVLRVVAHGVLGEPLALLLDVDLQTPLRSGDRLVLCGHPQALSGWTADDLHNDSPHLLWASWLRRQGRVFWQTMRGLELAVVICTLVLLVVIAGSTAVFHLGVQKYSLPDALFRTISVMAAGANLREVEGESGTIKVFVSVLRIFGMALMAAFTAIVTNYLLRARLRGALELRRIPESGHFVVVGLTSVGFRVTEALLQAKEKVVVLELDADNRFVATARRLGAAVIVGDATVPEVLRQAHAGSARAVLALGNKDLGNLEIGLLVRDLNETQRVVVLMEDPQLAEMLRNEANIRLAVSLPGLAAPAFLAALFGDRILSVFLLEEQLLAVLDLDVSASESLFVEQSLRAVAVDYRLLPITVVTPQGPPAQLFNYRLQAGDRIIAVLTLPDLEALLRRRPPACDHTVVIDSCPLPTRSWLVGLVCTVQGVPRDEAEQAIERLPMRLPNAMSKGRAEDLLARLLRERVAAKVVSLAEVG